MAKEIKVLNASLYLDTGGGGAVNSTIYTVPTGRVAKVTYGATSAISTSFYFQAGTAKLAVPNGETNFQNTSHYMSAGQTLKGYLNAGATGQTLNYSILVVEEF